MFALVLSLLGGCILPSKLVTYQTPQGVDPLPQPVSPLRVQYEVLGSATATVCHKIQDLGATGPTGLPLGAFPSLVDEARYAALETIPRADNLMYVRVKTESDNVQQCVTLTGRAYRVLSMGSGGEAPPSGGSGPSAGGVPMPPPMPLQEP